SRRRHTRFSRDWSSDVCSSDLTGEESWDRVIHKWPTTTAKRPERAKKARLKPTPSKKPHKPPAPLRRRKGRCLWSSSTLPPWRRSEERRVGKECRGQRSADQSR